MLTSGLALLILLSGCANQITMDQVDPFGSIGSATWFESEQLYWYPVQDHTPAIVLSSVPHLCDRLQSIAEDYDALYQRLMADRPLTSSAQQECEEYGRIVAGLEDLFAPLFPKDAHYLVISMRELDALEEGMWGVDDFQLTVAYYPTTDAYGVLSELHDEVDCGAAESGGWTSGWERGLGDIEVWRIAEHGMLEVAAAERGGRAEGTFGGALVDNQGARAGDISGQFSASWCDAPEPEHLLF